LFYLYFDLYSAKCVGIPLLENLFSQSLPVMLAFCSLLLQTYYSKNFAGIIGASLIKRDNCFASSGRFISLGEDKHN